MPATLKLPLAKLALAVTASLTALAIPFLLITQETAIKTVKYYGYWLMLATCALFFWRIWRETRKVSIRQLRNLAYRHGIGLLLAATITCFLQGQDEDGFKILYDEHVLSSTAMNLHKHQIAYVQAAGHVVSDETIASIGHVDKRPLLFPFVLSLAHNLLGYNYENVFALNAALTFAALALLYGLLAKLTNRTYGWLGLLLFGGLPLLAQNANGGGYEILNLCLILGLALSAIHYFHQKEGTAGLDLMIMTAILLANVRYESILYVLVPAAVFLLKSLHEGRLQLTWFSVLSPLLLVLPLISFSIFQNEPLFIRTSQDNFFSLSHLPGNLADAGIYLFDWSGSATNSVLLSIIGLPGILLFFIYFSPHLLKFGEKKDAIVLLLIAFIVLTNTVLALCNHWGAWTDPATSRFSLPLQLLMAVCPALVLFAHFRRTTAPAGLIALAFSYLLFVTFGYSNRMRPESPMDLAEGYHWAMHWIRDQAPAGNHLYIAQSASGFGLLQVGAIPFGAANASPQRVIDLKAIGIYDEIFAFEALAVTDNGEIRPLPGAGALSSRFDLATCEQFYINTKVFYRISQVTGLEPLPEGKEGLPIQPSSRIRIEDMEGPDLYRFLPLAP